MKKASRNEEDLLTHPLAIEEPDLGLQLATERQTRKGGTPCAKPVDGSVRRSILRAEGVPRSGRPGLRLDDTNGAGDRQELRRELYQRLKRTGFFQRTTSDIVWQPESYVYFSWQVDPMVRQHIWHKRRRPDVLDRGIYPEATADFATLRWPKSQLDSDPATDDRRGEMPGPFTYD